MRLGHGAERRRVVGADAGERAVVLGIRRANMEEPDRKIHTGGRAVVRAAA
jgi:hypothetical protein